MSTTEVRTAEPTEPTGPSAAAVAIVPNDAVQPPRKFNYIPAFDGIRGFGVALMLLWHAEVSWLGDGALFTIEFFFAISGFLIASLFLIERDNTGTISLKRFWTRRARRLLPAFVGMFLLITVWAAIPTANGGPSGTETHQMRGAGIASVVYVENWYFIFSDQSYFERFDAPPPTEHTWSLSVEEQFYILVALAMSYGLAKWSSRKKRWIIITGGLAVLSAVWMAFLARMGALVAEGMWPFGIDPASLSPFWQKFLNFQGSGDPSRMYLGTDTRLQASLVGVCMAFVVDRINWDRVSAAWIRFCAVVGIGGMIVMWTTVPKNVVWIYYGGFFFSNLLTCLMIIAFMAPRDKLRIDSFPRRGMIAAVAGVIAVGVAISWVTQPADADVSTFVVPAILTIIGAAAVGSLLAAKRDHITRPLEIKPLIKLGILSYGMYVWHYPIYVMLDGKRIIPLDQGWQLASARIGITLVVATLSYRYFENPLRIKGLPTRGLQVVAGVVCAAIFASFLVITTINGTESTFAQQATYTSVDCRRPNGQVDTCVPILWAGDSMAHAMGIHVNAEGADRADGYLGYLATTLGCGLVRADSIINGTITAQNPICYDWQTLWKQQIVTVKPAVSLVVAWGWDIYDRRVPAGPGEFTEVLVGSPEWYALDESTIQEAIDILASQGGKVALLTMPCIDLAANTKSHPNSQAAEPHRVKAINTAIRNVAARNPATTMVFDMFAFACPDGVNYLAQVDGIDQSDDGLHFTPPGSIRAWNWLKPQLDVAVGKAPAGS